MISNPISANVVMIALIIRSDSEISSTLFAGCVHHEFRWLH